MNLMTFLQYLPALLLNYKTRFILQLIKAYYLSIIFILKLKNNYIYLKICYNNTLNYIPNLIGAIKAGLEKLKSYYSRKLTATTMKESKLYCLV